MISSLLGYMKSEFFDEIIIYFMSIYSLNQPLAIILDYAKFIADKIHDQFMRFEMKECLSIPHFYIIYSCITSLIDFQFPYKSWIPKETPD